MNVGHNPSGQTISNYVGKIHRDMFGKGPDRCHTFVTEHIVVVYIRGFISAMEAVLIEQNQLDMAAYSRTLIVSRMLAELRGVFQLELGRDVRDFYQDWNFANNTGILLAVLDRESEAPLFQGPLSELLISEVVRLSVLTEKAPDETIVHRVSQSIYVVIRHGILIPLEKAMVAKGLDRELRIAKTDLEKTAFHRGGNFSDVFGTTVSDIFLDWNLHRDTSVLCFVLGHDE